MKTKLIGIILLFVGLLGIAMSMLMFGDIGIACLVGAITALLSGLGFISLPIPKQKTKDGINNEKKSF